MHILIAEDDTTSRTMLTALLRKWDHEVTATVNGAEALQSIQQQNSPRLAILDWMMPEMDGLEVCRRVRAMGSELPHYIIMLTSKDRKMDIIAGLEAGADDYLVKPFDPGELEARVEVGRRILELQSNLADKARALQKALDEVRTLRGIVPICANCKKIRDDKGFWNQVESYVRDHSEAELTHGICPECLVKLYPKYAKPRPGM